MTFLQMVTEEPDALFYLMGKVEILKPSAIAEVAIENDMTLTDLAEKVESGELDDIDIIASSLKRNACKKLKYVSKIG